MRLLRLRPETRVVFFSFLKLPSTFTIYTVLGWQSTEDSAPSIILRRCNSTFKKDAGQQLAVRVDSTELGWLIVWTGVRQLITRGGFTGTAYWYNHSETLLSSEEWGIKPIFLLNGATRFSPCSYSTMGICICARPVNAERFTMLGFASFPYRQPQEIFWYLYS